MNTTTILFCILAVVFAVLTIVYCNDLGRHKAEIARLFSQVSSLTRENDELEKKMSKDNHHYFAVVGDHFHGLEYIIEKGNREYLPLVVLLGQYVRSSSWNKPLFENTLDFDMVSLKSDFQYPCLDKEQSDRLKALLNSIIAGSVNPLALVELMDLLAGDTQYDNAMKLIEWKFRDKTVC